MSLEKCKDQQDSNQKTNVISVIYLCSYKDYLIFTRATFKSLSSAYTWKHTVSSGTLNIVSVVWIWYTTV